MNITFPILNQHVNDHPLVYLDNAATTQKPQCVLDTVVDVYTRYNSNIHRGIHHLSNVCTDIFEQARQKVATHINARQKEEIVFTRGTTEAINLLAFSFGETYCHEGDEIVITAMDHHANIVPWQMLCNRKHMTLRVAPINDSGELVLSDLYALLNDRTKLLCIPHVSNVLGTVNPVREIIRTAHQKGIRVFLDAAQSMPHMKIDVQDIDCDFMAFSGHKMYAPNGSGALYGKYDLLDELVPYHGGGEMIEKVTFEKTTYAKPPLKFEAGTPDYVAAIALGTAVDFMQSIGLDEIEKHDRDLVQYCIDRLRPIPGISFVGEADNHSGCVSFLLEGLHPADVGMMLDKMGIAVRTGHHCAQPLMERFGIPGTVRASFAIYNHRDDVDALANALQRISAIIH